MRIPVRRTIAIAMCVAAAAALVFVRDTAVAWAQTLRDSRFDVVSVTLAGPSSINNGASANYTVAVSIRRTGASPDQTIVGTSGVPRIRPALYSDNTQLTFREIDFGPGENTKTVTLSLTCQNNEVRGSVAGSGHGNRNSRPWWCLWLCTVADPAMVKGHLNERESATIAVLCN